MSTGPIRHSKLRGRGATFNPANRYLSTETLAVDDGWHHEAGHQAAPSLVQRDSSRTVLSYNDSPDVPFDRSLNPYRGCEHGCIYCYARPGHAWLGLSPGLDFETRLFCKTDAAALLRRELAARGYRPATLALGGSTDAYQPAERRLRITRSILEVLAETRHPVTVVTKSALIERDIDLLCELTQHDLVSVFISLSTLDTGLTRTLEPRASAPPRRLESLRRLSAAGIPCGILAAPVIPGMTDAELEKILSSAREAGAAFAAYVLLRLPQEVAPLFQDWLRQHHPDKASRVMNLIRSTRAGRDNDSRFGSRMRGEGPVAGLIAQRFDLACKRLGLGGAPALRSDRFRAPSANPGQLALF